jgi:hypothetical protein
VRGASLIAFSRQVDDSTPPESYRMGAKTHRPPKDMSQAARVVRMIKTLCARGMTRFRRIANKGAQ